MKSYSYVQIAVLAIAFGLASAPLAHSQSVSLPREISQQLDPFESHRLNQADQQFAQRNYSAARAAYDAFLLEFPDSIAVPYAVYQKGHSLQLENRRFEAIRVYQEVIDYFPDDLVFASSALYRIGEAHEQNGDMARALAAWRRLVDDEGYRAQPMAAPALNKVATQLSSEGRHDEAARYYRMVAVQFNRQHNNASRDAMNRVLDHYTRTNPNRQVLREFFDEIGGFGHNPATLPAGDERERMFWSQLFNIIARNDRFNDAQLRQRQAYFKYWADQMGNAHPDWDHFQINRINFRFAADGNEQRRTADLDRLFARGESNNQRALRWMTEFAENEEKAREYFGKIEGNRLDFDQSRQLLRLAAHTIRNRDLTQAVVRKLPLRQLDDNQKLTLANENWQQDIAAVRTILQSTENKDFGRFHLLRFYNARGDHQAGLPLAEEVIVVPEYASMANFYKGELLTRANRFEDAIAAFRLSEHHPHSLWRIADNYVRLGDPDRAIQQLREIENFFKDSSPEAALRIARVHRDVGDQQQYIASLRGILQKYPESTQSRTAHVELERLGVRTGGGLDAES